MTKNFVKRSQFMFVSLTDGNHQSVLVEADEAYITVMNYNSNTLLVRRQQERDLKKALDVNGGLVNGSGFLQEWNGFDYYSGTVALDVRNLNGTLANTPITAQSGDGRYAALNRSASVGFKELVDFRAANADFPLNICIETVHYVPADVINA